LWSYFFGTGPGSESCITGTAKFKKQFFILTNFSYFKILTNSIVCNAAIAAVVVANAGTILPAFNLVVSQSNGYKV